MRGKEAVVFIYKILGHTLKVSGRRVLEFPGSPNLTSVWTEMAPEAPKKPQTKRLM